MEGAGLISRQRDKDDERCVIITITKMGIDLRGRAVLIPSKMGGCINLGPEESKTLYTLLYKLLGQLES